MNTVISKDGTSIAFDKTGEGPALVLVDGAFCYRTYGVTPNLVPLLSDHFTVYAYDRRGRGDSGDTKPYDVLKEIEDLNSIIDATKETPFICGFSSGASLVMQAIADGSLAKRIALFEPPFVAKGKNDGPSGEEAIAELEKLISCGERTNAVKYFMTKVMGMPSIFVWLFKTFAGKMFKNNERVAHTLAYDITILETYKEPKVPGSKITVPALVISGDKSPVKLIDAAKRTAQSIPDAELLLLKGQNHNVSMKALAPVLINFFK